MYIDSASEDNINEDKLARLMIYLLICYFAKRITACLIIAEDCARIMLI